MKATIQDPGEITANISFSLTACPGWALAGSHHNNTGITLLVLDNRYASLTRLHRDPVETPFLKYSSSDVTA